MERKGLKRALGSLNEHFASVWTLMSDTTIFLSNHTKILYQYERQLRELRHTLERNRKNERVVQQVRRDLVAIRKSLRMQGYNLRLGSRDLRVQGFRNDEALAEGFSRCVLFLMEDEDILYISGEANHIELDRILEQRLSMAGYRPILQKHFLWYKWANRILYLSGAATETKENFEDFRVYAEKNKGKIIQRMSKLS